MGVAEGRLYRLESEMREDWRVAESAWISESIKKESE